MDKAQRTFEKINLLFFHQIENLFLFRMHLADKIPFCHPPIFYCLPKSDFMKNKKQKECAFCQFHCYRFYFRLLFATNRLI